MKSLHIKKLNMFFKIIIFWISKNLSCRYLKCKKIFYLHKNNYFFSSNFSEHVHQGWTDGPGSQQAGHTLRPLWQPWFWYVVIQNFSVQNLKGLNGRSEILFTVVSIGQVYCAIYDNHDFSVILIMTLTFQNFTMLTWCLQNSAAKNIQYLDGNFVMFKCLKLGTNCPL
jgi:hypothetical protein